MQSWYLQNNFQSFLFKSLFLTFVLLIHLKVDARPEYAVRHSLVSCSNCHVNPFGGGQRNMFGKGYGAHGNRDASPFKTEWFSFDSRMEYLYQKGKTATPTGSETPQEVERKGLIVMTSVAGVNAPLTQNEKGEPTSRFALEQDFGLRGAGLRTTYAIFNFRQPGEVSLLNHVIVGRINLPFGLMTDEHRTLTKIQTATSTFDYEAGMGFVGEPILGLHYDLLFTDGFEKPSGGGSGPSNNSSPWGATANIRWGFPEGPFFAGVSHSRHGTREVKDNVQIDYDLNATALFFVLSFDRATKGAFNGSLQAEGVWARGYSHPNLSFKNGGILSLINSDTWKAELKDAQSFGAYGLFNYDLSEKFVLQYKYEQLVPNTAFSADSFYIHGIGFKYFLNSQMDITTRMEVVNVTRSGETEAAASAASRNAFYSLLHVWF